MLIIVTTIEKYIIKECRLTLIVKTYKDIHAGGVTGERWYNFKRKIQLSHVKQETLN